MSAVLHGSDDESDARIRTVSVVAFFLIQIGRKLIFRCARHRTDARDGCHFSCHEINRINVQCTVHHCRLDYVAFVF